MAYKVKAGDTLSGLYGSNWKQLSGYTGDPTKLQIGTELPDLPGTNVPPAVNPTPTATVSPVVTPPNISVDPDDAKYLAALARKEAADEAASNAPVLTEEETQANVIRMFQGEIDAANKVYADKIAAARLEGQGRLGSEGAIQARRGLLGSTFGEASTTTVNQGNRAIESAIGDELDAKLQSIMSLGRSEGTKRFEAATKARTEGLDAYILDLQNKGTAKKTIAQKLAQSFIDKGVDPNTLTPDYLEQLAKDAGISKESIISGYKELSDAKKKAEADAVLETRKTLAAIGKDEADIQQSLASIAKTKAETTKLANEAGTKEEKEMFDDILKMQTNLSSGKTDWGQAWNYIRERYNVPQDKWPWLDEILNKEVWSKEGAYQSKVLGGTPQGAVIMQMGG
jgi:hypothetical protein